MAFSVQKQGFVAARVLAVGFALGTTGYLVGSAQARAGAAENADIESPSVTSKYAEDLPVVNGPGGDPKIPIGTIADPWDRGVLTVRRDALKEKQNYMYSSKSMVMSDGMTLEETFELAEIEKKLELLAELDAMKDEQVQALALIEAQREAVNRAQKGAKNVSPPVDKGYLMTSKSARIYRPKSTDSNTNNSKAND